MAAKKRKAADASGAQAVRDALAISGTGVAKLAVVDGVIANLVPGGDVEAATEAGADQYESACAAVEALRAAGASNSTVGKAQAAADALKPAGKPKGKGKG